MSCEKMEAGKGDPQVLDQTVWWLLTQYFGLRGRQEHHSMRAEDFTYGQDENNTEYFEFIETPTKTRQSGLSAKNRRFLPEMFATGVEHGVIVDSAKVVPLNINILASFILSLKLVETRSKTRKQSAEHKTRQSSEVQIFEKSKGPTDYWINAPSLVWKTAGPLPRFN